MSDQQWHEVNQKLESKGWVLEGAVMLPGDSSDDDMSCPSCGRGGYWCVLYKRGQNEQRFASANLCYDCGHIWVEEDGE